MQRSVLLAALVAATGVAASTAEATIRILKDDGSPAEPTEATLTFNAATGGWDITLSALYAPGGETVYRIRGDGGETIDNIFIDVPCWTGPNGLCVPAGSPLFVHVHSDPPAGITTIHNIIQTGDAETLLLDVQAEQDIGSVTAQVIGTVVAGRDLIGPVIATTGNNTSRGINWVEAHRDILGDVITENGRIGRVWAYQNMGTPVEPIQIRARHKINGIYSGDGFCVLAWLAGETVTCNGEIYADINTRANGGAGPLFRLFARRFEGTVETEALRPDSATGVPGQIGITESFEGKIVFGRPLNRPDQSIELPMSGFSGQIIVNADNITGGGWVTPVHLGSAAEAGRVTIVGPHYPQTADELGGGSIGLVPFALHLSSTEPQAGASVAGTTPVVVDLRHYGPVVVAGGQWPVIVQRRPAGSTGGFEPVAFSNFQIGVAPEDPNTLRLEQAPGGSGFEPGFEYSITPTAQLRCGIPGEPPVVWTVPDHRFTVTGGGCVGDLDGSGAVDVVDLLVLLASWGPAPGSPADLTGDGSVDVQDLLILLAAWGPC